ncbi:uncharacterized protein DS421_16g555000 [Arachis hypogaea]|nr:uncharacterized protein DS421_16g555000 [Arachis hypogaea]
MAVPTASMTLLIASWLTHLLPSSSLSTSSLAPLPSPPASPPPTTTEFKNMNSNTLSLAHPPSCNESDPLDSLINTPTTQRRVLPNRRVHSASTRSNILAFGTSQVLQFQPPQTRNHGNIICRKNRS